MRKLTIAEARRLALARQGFADPRPTGRVDKRHLRRVVDRVGVVQIDSVNVVARAHYLPFFARLGNYPTGLLDEMCWGPKSELVEYWAHMAAFVPKSDWPLFRHRMEKEWQFADRWLKETPGGKESILAQVKETGPIRPADIEGHQTGLGPWWNWSPTKAGLEALYFLGHLGISHRVNFTRHYDLIERVVPDSIRAVRLTEEEQRTGLIRKAIRSLGVATQYDLTDYHRQSTAACVPLIKELVASGDLEEVEVEGWTKKAYLDPAATIPRKIEGVALLNPFDPVIWNRRRSEALFDFTYRIEIYTPAPKRIYGYYVFAVLLDDQLVGRVDLKADRAKSALLVRGSYHEQGQDPKRIGPRLRQELRTMADWLELDDVVIEKKGNLAPGLKG